MAPLDGHHKRYFTCIGRCMNVNLMGEETLCAMDYAVGKV